MVNFTIVDPSKTVGWRSSQVTLNPSGYESNLLTETPSDRAVT